MGSVSVVLLLLDTFLRRFLLPLALLSAIIFRYNVLSVIYLLFFIVLLVIPSPRLKSQKYVTLIVLLLLLVSSVLFLCGQALFQLTLPFFSPFPDCGAQEYVLRQVGVVQFSRDVPVRDILRLLLVDVVVAVPALVAVIVNILLLRSYRKVAGGDQDTAGREESGGRASGVEEEAIRLQDQPPHEGGELRSLTGSDNDSYDPSVQCYLRVPDVILYLLQVLIFALLGLAGVAVPSLTSSVYFLSCLGLLIIWSVHRKAAGFVRVLRVVLLFYSSSHLLVLDLYQLQSAQDNIPLLPNDTDASLLARLFGLTAIIRTDCNSPSSLLVYPDLNYVNYVNPALLLALVWVLATDCRLWLSTPSCMWKKYGQYYLPITDHQDAPPTIVRVHKGVYRSIRTDYGAMDNPDAEGLETSLRDPYRELLVIRPHRALEVWHRVWEGLVSVYGLLFYINYVFAIVAMMAWSVAFPSWPSLVFLLWACGIWLLPNATPRKAVLYSSPLLVVYSTVLLLLQYMFSLDIGVKWRENATDIVDECDRGTEEGCKSWALLAKTCLTIVFFAAFREYIPVFIRWWRKQEWCGWSGRQSSSRDDAGSSTVADIPDGDPSVKIQQREKTIDNKYRGLLQLVGTYWILAVVGAFLLVFLSGEPGFLKTVYLIFFFYLILTYQLVERWWIYVNYPVWCILIVYAVIHLLLVYTYNFKQVADQWGVFFDKTIGKLNINVTNEEWYTSVGMERYDQTVRSLLTTLVPPAVFIAVLAMQLRFFRPSRNRADVNFQHFVPNFVQAAIKNFQDFVAVEGNEEFVLESSSEDEGVEGENEEATEEVQREGGAEKDSHEGDVAGVGHGEDNVDAATGETAEEGRQPSPLIQPAPLLKTASESAGSTPDSSPSVRRRAAYQRQSSFKRQSTIHSSLTWSQKLLVGLYKLLAYLFNKTRVIILSLAYLTWRFLQLHLYKMIMILLFACSISQVSVLYWLLLVGVVILVPLPRFQRLTLPLVTLYLGVVILAKMVYQFPVIQVLERGLPEGDRECEAIPVDKSQGQVFMHRFSPQGGNLSWIGLHSSTGEFSGYISLPIICSLLLTLWFSVDRFQRHYYRNSGIIFDSHEDGALFLNVPRREAEVSLWAAIKYWINHFFELYGVEVCMCVMAIMVAIRVDVYGIFYACVLGLFLLVPRKAGKGWLAVWITYLILHGCLLVVQYFFLLGIPTDDTYCLTDSYVYPWSNITVKYVQPVAFKKWLFLPADEDQILSRNLLYADFLVYLLLCLQLWYFFKNPLKHGTSDHYTLEVSVLNFINCNILMDYIKYFVFQYFYWITLFLLFVTAVVRVSILGLFYLLAIFILLYRGEEMLKDVMKRRRLAWSLLRWFSWCVLLLRVSLQILDCCMTLPSYSSCVSTVLYNGACTESFYYGVATEMCAASNVGLWVDAFNFAVITLQMVIMDTKYTDLIRQDLMHRETNAKKFREIFDRIVEEKQNLAKENRENQIHSIKKRAESLDVTGKTVDHILYRGVRIPKDVQVHKLKQGKRDGRRKDNYFDINLLSPRGSRENTASAEPEDLEVDPPWYSKLWGMIKSFLLNFVDEFTRYLEDSSALYLQVVKAVGEVAPPENIQSTGLSPESESRGAEATDGAAQEGGGAQGENAAAKPAKLDQETVKEKEKRPKEKTRKRLRILKRSKSHKHQDEVVGTDGPPVAAPTEDGKPAQDPPAAGKVEAANRSSENEYSPFDNRGDILERELHIRPSEEAQRETDKFEEKIVNRASVYTQKLFKLLRALYEAFLSHSEYVAYFLIIVNIILNGGVVGLIFAALLFFWGLLSNPWPTKVFWLTLIFYSMLVLGVKYAFQVAVVIVQDNDNVDDHTFASVGGLNYYTVFGIQYRENFLSNASWDMVLLIALLVHRGLLKQNGLWIAYGNLVSSFLTSVKQFFKTLVDPDITLGAKDYYVVMLFFDILTFITLVLGVNSFGVGAGDNITAVASFFRTNQIPIFFLVMLLLQFLSMLADRAIYLRHSVRIKLVFQVILLIGWHVGLFFVLPSTLVSDKPFVNNLAAKFAYFFKACYFIASSFQIISGYPVRLVSYFLTTRSNLINYLAFQVYRVIPLLPELREVMDWSFTQTTLSLLSWFRVQEIYAQLYLVKVRRDRESGSKRSLGDQQSFLIKISLGFLLLTGLILLIWGPLIFVSLITSTSPSSLPTEVNVKLNLAGFQPLVQLTGQQNPSITALTDIQYDNLTQHFQDHSDFNVLPLFRQQLSKQNFRRVKLRGTSTSLWTISPPARQLLEIQLQQLKEDPSKNIVLEFSWSISRPTTSTSVSETVSGSQTTNLNYMTHNDTIDSFLQSLNPEEGSTPPQVFLQGLFPVVMVAPAATGSTEFTVLTETLNNRSFASVNAFVNLTTVGSGDSTREWWEIRQDNTSSTYIVNDPDDVNDFIELFIYSSPVPPALFQAVAALGITGLYSAIVLAIGRLIRGYISNLPSRLIIDEILYPEPLIKLCDDIFFLRETKKFQLEEIYVGKLFYIFRSPEKIIELTEEPKRKVD